MVNDSQRQRAYNMEFALRRRLEGTGTKYRWGQQLSEDAIAQLANQVWRRYHGKNATPLVILFSGGARSTARYRWGTVKLPPWARTADVVLHEVAHGVVTRGAAHGPEFVRLLFELWNHYLGTDMSVLKATAREYSVRLAQMSKVPKPLGRDRVVLPIALPEAAARP